MQPEHSPSENEPSHPQARQSTWFYIQHGETFGPVTSPDLRAAAHLGFLGPNDMVRRSDRSEWMPARSIRGLFKDSA